MVYKIYLSSLIILFSNILFGQDTIFLEKPKIYVNDDYRNAKNCFSKELIKLKPDSFKIEDCYYIIEKKKKTRISGYNITLYKLDNDSLVKIWNYDSLYNWFYIKQSDTLYKVWNGIDSGYAKSLVPFIKNGHFKQKLSNNSILDIEYNNGHFAGYKVENEPLKEDIFKFEEVDVKPEYPGGDSALFKFIARELKFPEVYHENSIAGSAFVKCVINKNGIAKNIEVFRGLDPFFDIEALKVIAKLSGFKPGIKNGQSVNTTMIIRVKFQLN